MATLYVRKIPDSLQRKFRSICVLKGVTMTDYVKGLMTAVVNGELEIDSETGLVFVGRNKKKA